MAALVGLGATAQAKMLAFGVKGGINMPSFETNLGNFESDANVGFHAGVFGQLNIPIIGLGVQPELLYLSQSVSYINKEQNNASKSASYLDIPINITWGIDLKVVRPFIAVTPYLRYSFSEVETYVTTAAASGQAPEPQKLNSFDYGLGAGAGIDLFSKIQLMGRYSWGLSDLVSSGNYKVRSFTLSLGYIF
ncbi:MAG: PorT family protein [Prevotellaceae bacterium]|nr:PorT family protein [Prevotellaceae bacterium]